MTRYESTASGKEDRFTPLQRILARTILRIVRYRDCRSARQIARADDAENRAQTLRML
jgi:hypothetical protein